MVHRIDLRSSLAAFALSVCIVLIYIHLFSGGGVARTSVREFPARIGDWVGTEVPLDKEVVRILNPDRVIQKSYQKANSPPVNLLVLYYGTIEKADLSHSPIVCFTGQGWEIEDTTVQSIPVSGVNSSHIKVNQLVQKKLDTRMITLFWYQSAQKAYHNRGKQKLALFWDKVFGRSDRNAFVRITVNIPSDKSVEEVKSYLTDFIRKSYPEILRFLI